MSRALSQRGSLQTAPDSSSAALDRLNTQRSVALRPWHAALAGRDSARAVAVCVGDSITEGIGAGTNDTKWTSWVQRLLRARFPLTSPVTGGPGYYAAYLGSGSVPSPGVWSTTGSPAQRGDWGLGRRELLFSAAGTATATFTGTDALIMYGKGDNLASSFTYTVDGGSAQTVSWGATIAPAQSVAITGLSAGSHTIVITWVSGTVYLNGLWVFNGDYAKGIHVLDAGHSGYYTSGFIGSNGYWLQDINSVSPALITIELGVNDQRLAAISSAQYQTNLTTLVSQVKGALTKPCSIVLVAAYQPTGSFTEPWANYVQAMRNVAAADPSLLFLDLGLRMEPALAANVNGLYLADLIHPSASGHPFIGQIVADFMAPR